MKNRLLIPVAFFTFVIVLAHFFAPPSYHWQQNTISELASQGHKNAWIMRSGLVGFGILLAFKLIPSVRRQNYLAIGNVFIVIYGTAILLSGLFSTAPIDPNLSYSLTEAKLHSLFATIAGLSLSIAIAWRIFFSSQPSHKLLHFVFLLMVIGLSFAFGLAENEMLLIGKGIVQRLLYLTGFVWLLTVGYLSAKTA